MGIYKADFRKAWPLRLPPMSLRHKVEQQAVACGSLVLRFALDLLDFLLRHEHDVLIAWVEKQVTA